MASKMLRKIKRQILQVLFMITNPFKKIIILAFVFSLLHVMFMRKLLIQGIICNIFDNDQHHPNDPFEPPDTHCRDRFSQIYYVMMCCFLVLMYFIFLNFAGSVLFYSPVYYLFSIINRVNFNIRVGFNINFLLISFFLISTSFVISLFWKTKSCVENDGT